MALMNELGDFYKERSDHLGIGSGSRGFMNLPDEEETPPPQFSIAATIANQAPISPTRMQVPAQKNPREEGVEEVPRKPPRHGKSMDDFHIEQKRKLGSNPSMVRPQAVVTMPGDGPATARGGNRAQQLGIGTGAQGFLSFSTK